MSAKEVTDKWEKEEKEAIKEARKKAWKRLGLNNWEQKVLGVIKDGE